MIAATQASVPPIAIQPPARTLDLVATGATVVLASVHGEAGIRRRLLEMGLCPGVPVEVLRRAPLGDPIELRVRGYLLSVRAEQARLIAVSPHAGP